MLFMMHGASRCAKSVHKCPPGTHSAMESGGQRWIFYKGNYLANIK